MDLLKRANREKVLAKISKLSLLQIHLFDLHFYDLSKKTIRYKLNYCEKVLLEIHKILNKKSELIVLKEKLLVKDCCDGKLENRLKKFDDYIKKINDADLNSLIKEISLTLNCVSKDKIVSFESLVENQNKTTKDIFYIHSDDIYKLGQTCNNLGEDLSYIYYRARLINGGIPLFVTKEQYEEFENLVEKIYGDRDYFKYDVPFNKFRQEYNYTDIVKEKEYYESVFPQFDFKFKDRNVNSGNQFCYIVEFKNNYD